MLRSVRMDCPSADEIGAFFNLILNDPAAESVASHVESCERCHDVLLALARERRAHEARSLDHDEAADLSLRVGGLVGRYTMRKLVGVGGMGVVYEAWDAELQRRVAIKLIRRDKNSVDNLRARLMREAQAMARLSHPNVLNVHETGTHDGRVFLAMEYVDGGTLTDWLQARRRTWREIVRAFVAAGHGLSAAHKAGLVHRDFKPDNVLVRADGRVCVGDFGLARASEESDADAEAELLALRDRPIDEKLTRTGTVVGTPAYMAPEQARGRAVDERSDQFSYCLALYEALFGVAAFDGRTLNERLANMARGPRRTSTNAVPRHIRSALERGLNANPERRFASMDALLTELEARRFSAGWWIAAAALALTGAVAWRIVGKEHASRPEAVVQSVRRLTFTPGCEDRPSFADDGRTIVYGGEALDGERQIYAIDAAGGTPRQLTHGPGFNDLPSTSPDGKRIAFVHEHDGPRSLYVMPVEGGAPSRKVTPLYAGGMGTWQSPSVVAAYDVHANAGFWNVDTQELVRVVELPSEHNIFTVSPFADGALAVDWRDTNEQLGVGVIEANGPLRVLAEQQKFLDLGGVVAAPSQRSIYFARHNGAIKELVRLPRQGGPLEVVGGGVVPEFGFAISADGKKLAFSNCARFNHIVRLDGTHQITPLIPSGDWADHAAVTLDANQIIWSSNRSGNQDVLLLDQRVGTARLLMRNAGVELGGVSHDGRSFTYTTDHPPGVWIRSLDGGARKLTDNPSDASPAFTRDDSQIVFLRVNGGASHLWIVDRDGGHLHQLVEMPAREPLTSGKDDRIAFSTRVGDAARIMLTDAQGRAPAPAAAPPFPMSDGNLYGYTRSHDGRRVMAIRAGFEIVEVELDSARPATVVQSLSRWIDGVDYAFDDRAIYATLSYGEGDVWLAEGFFP